MYENFNLTKTKTKQDQQQQQHQHQKQNQNQHQNHTKNITTTTITTTSKTPPKPIAANNASLLASSVEASRNLVGHLVAPATTTRTTTTTTSISSDKSNSSRHQLSPSKAYSSCSVLTPTKVADPSLLESCNPITATHMTLLSHRRRRLLQRHACLLSILAAFIVGLILGVLAPMIGISNIFAATSTFQANADDPKELGFMTHLPILGTSSVLKDHPQNDQSDSTVDNDTNAERIGMPPQQPPQQPPSDFPTIYGLQQAAQRNSETKKPNTGNQFSDPYNSPYSVAFVKEQNPELPPEDIFRNAFNIAQIKDAPNAMIVKKLDMEDGSIKQFRADRLGTGRFRKGPEKRLSKPILREISKIKLKPKSKSIIDSDSDSDSESIPLAERIIANTHSDKQHPDIIKSDIYWGDLIEKALPHGYSKDDAKSWNDYVTSKGIVMRFESGCGRMQNRLIIFADGTRACARYRQNTDQIQGEIFSFFLGQLLNISNLAPSAATVVDIDSNRWSGAIADITQAQWKQQRPVVLTRWLPDLEPAGIPQPFQPLERHLNKYDVWNITLSAGIQPRINAVERGLLWQRLDNSTQHNQSPSTSRSSSSSSSSSSVVPTPVVMQRLVELAQWSDLIVFDYLIANLDRVVNNLYNFQWNADIMAAPAHNLARQTNTQLLVFLDNESGLLHGYRLLKKYEAYHGLLLDNLCVFRQPTIDALRQLRSNGPGRKLREIFEQTTSNAVRDVLPSLPDKSIKILVDRIDRVLGQVQKCKDLLSNR